jgi:hypothetical protein
VIARASVRKAARRGSGRVGRADEQAHLHTRCYRPRVPDDFACCSSVQPGERQRRAPAALAALHVRLGAGIRVEQAALTPGLAATLRHAASIHNALFYERQRARIMEFLAVKAGQPRPVRRAHPPSLPNKRTAEVHDYYDELSGSRFLPRQACPRVHQPRLPGSASPLAEGHLISTAVTEQLSASEVKKWGPLVRSLERIVTHIVTTTPDFHRRSATASDTCKAPNCRNATSRDRLRRNCRAWRVERDGVD